MYQNGSSNYPRTQIKGIRIIQVALHIGVSERGYGEVSIFLNKKHHPFVFLGASYIPISNLDGTFF